MNYDDDIRTRTVEEHSIRVDRIVLFCNLMYL